MALNPWQKLSWVLPGLPFGDAYHGNITAEPTPTRRSVSGTSGANTLTLGSSGYANGDVLLVMQMRGTNAGKYEFVRVLSGGGTTTLTLTKNLVNTYTDSGASQAQAIEIKRALNVTVQSSNWIPTSWGGDTGGIFPIAARGTLTTSVKMQSNGNSVSSGSYGDPGTGASGGGFRGGAGQQNYAYQGEGTLGAGVRQNLDDNNGNGGGPGHHNGNSNNISIGGGGGGNGEAGTVGKNGQVPGGEGGTTAGNSELTEMVMGGGGGGGASGTSAVVNSGPGGSGGGCFMIIAANIVLGANIEVIGGAGGLSDPYGGSGAGGSILLVCKTANIGTNQLKAAGGPYTVSTFGKGGGGRIAIHHSGTLTGSVSSSDYGTYANVTDPTLQEFGGAALMDFAQQ